MATAMLSSRHSHVARSSQHEGVKARSDDCLHDVLTFRAVLTCYALAAMVHCNISFLQCTIPMSCS
ncbi:hypothetical protein MPLB_680036 [Mesorhizobium sp. ORS 3324]|nr:hypothetical protein MPLB_680036 [Mesorhizobium sp. ORS 3324]